MWQKYMCRGNFYDAGIYSCQLELKNTFKWADVTSWSYHPGRKLEIVTLANGSQIFTDNDERAIYGYNISTDTYERHTPTEAKELGILIPIDDT